MIGSNVRNWCAVAPLFVLFVAACTDGPTQVNLLPAFQPATGPEPTCAGMLMVEKCWMRLADKNRCHVWQERPLAGHASVTWSGECRNGRAHGEGTLTIAWRNRWTRVADSVQEGELNDGKKTGKWVLRHAFLTERGEYKEGKRTGTWELSGANGWSMTERYMPREPLFD